MVDEPPVRLSQTELNERFVKALGSHCAQIKNAIHEKPLLLDLVPLLPLACTAAARQFVAKRTYHQYRASAPPSTRRMR